jgi:hypothetical protein
VNGYFPAQQLLKQSLLATRRQAAETPLAKEQFPIEDPIVSDLNVESFPIATSILL